MIDKPYELILAEDLIEQVQRKLGRQHPACRFLEYSLEFRKPSLPEHLQDRVVDDWVWYEQYPFWILTRLYRNKQLRPACWIKDDVLHRIQISNSDLFGLRPDAMEKEFEAIRLSWQQNCPRLVEEGSLRKSAPPGLGGDWLGMLMWREATEMECELMSTEVVPEYVWTPLYRYMDINRVVNIFSQDDLSLSPFGKTPGKKMCELVSRLRHGYGVEVPIERDYSDSRPALLKKARIEILSFLMKDQSLTYSDAKEQMDHWALLASSMVEKMQKYSDAGLVRTHYAEFLSRDLRAPVRVVLIVRGLLKVLGNDQAEYIQDVIFQCHEKTLRGEWRDMQGE